MADAQTDPLTPEQIEMLRAMPIGPYDVLADRDAIEKHTPLIDLGFCRRIYAGRRDGILQQTVGRTQLADLLLATIDTHPVQDGRGAAGSCQWGGECREQAVARCEWIEPRQHAEGADAEPFHEWLCVEHLADASRLFGADITERAAANTPPSPPAPTGGGDGPFYVAYNAEAGQWEVLDGEGTIWEMFVGTDKEVDADESAESLNAAWKEGHKAGASESGEVAKEIKIGLCEGCEPITPHELHALYSITGDHPAADEVVASVRKKLSHTLGDLPKGAVSDEYKDYWVADHFATQNPASGSDGLKEAAKDARDQCFAALGAVDDIENDVGGGLGGLRQAHGVMIGTIHHIKDNLAAALDTTQKEQENPNG